MPIIIKAPASTEYLDILAPDGIQAAICSDIVDLGYVETTWEGVTKSKPMIRITFLLDEKIPAQWEHPHANTTVNVGALKPDLVGRPFGVSRRFTANLHEKSSLRQFLKTWRGKDFTPEELDGFDVEKLIGVPAAITIVHNQNGGKWYANVEVASKLPKQWAAPQIPDDYVRIKDREPKEERDEPEPEPVAAGVSFGRGPDADFSGEPIPGDDELPF